MKRLLKWLLRLILLVLVLAGAFFVHVWYFKPARIDWFYTRTFAKFAVDSPEMLSNMRILPSWMDFYGNKLDDVSPAHEQEQADMVKHELETLHSYDTSGMGREERLSYDSLEYFLRIQVEGDKFRDLDYPVNQLFGVQSTLPNFMAQTHQVTNASEAKDYVARLDLFPSKFDQLIDSLKLRETKCAIPPQFTVDEVIAQMQGFIGKPAKENPLYATFKEKVDKIPADKMDAATRDKYLGEVEAAVTQKVYPSYTKLIAYFTALKPKATGNFGVWHLPDGDAYYAWCVRSNTTTDMTPE